MKAATAIQRPKSISTLGVFLLFGLAFLLAMAETKAFPSHESLLVNLGPEAEEQPSRVKKTVEFMGMHVSYPQYVRLRAIQREVIKMDQMIRRMMQIHDPIDLARNPHWMELLELYDAMKKMLPNEYLAKVGEENPVGVRRRGWRN